LKKIIHTTIKLDYGNDKILLTLKDMEKEIRKEVDDAVAQAKVIILIVSIFVLVIYQNTN